MIDGLVNAYSYRCLISGVLSSVALPKAIITTVIILSMAKSVWSLMDIHA